MQQNPVEFKKRRDFGAIFTDTFVFIGQEFRPLGMSVLYFAFPFILVAAISMFLFFHRFMPFFANPEAIIPSGFMKDILFFYFFMIILFLVSKLMFISTINNYIALYVEKGRGNFNAADVSHRIGSNFWPMLGTAILAGLMIGIGTLFCFLPGIYLAVSLSFIYIALIYEKKGFGDALSRTFELSNRQWWWTFLILMVMYIIITVVLMIPYFIYFAASVGSLVNLNMNHKPDPDQLVAFMKGYSIVLAIIIILSSLLQAIPWVAMALQYFNLAEMKDKESADSII